MDNNDYTKIERHPKSADFRRAGMQKLKGNWSLSLLVALVWIVILFAINFILKNFLSPIIEPLGVIILWPLLAGMLTFFLGVSRSEEKGFVTLFYMFRSPNKFFKSLAISFLVQLGTAIGCIFLVFPGLWFAYTFSQSINIFIDNNEIGVIEAMKESARIMKGEKWNLFKLQISFIGWWILLFVVAIIVAMVIGLSLSSNLFAPVVIATSTIVIMIIGMTWLFPYFITTILTFYNFVKSQNYKNDDAI